MSDVSIKEKIAAQKWRELMRSGKYWVIAIQKPRWWLRFRKIKTTDHYPHEKG